MKIKGVVLIARLKFIQERFGRDAFEEVLASLSSKDQSILRGIIMGAIWYPFETGENLDKATVKVIGNGAPDFFEEIGAASARQNLSTVHRAFLQPGQPQVFLNRSPLIYRFYYDVGRREYTETGPTSGVLVTYDSESYSVFDCLTVIGWYKQGLAMCGAQGVTIVERSCRGRGAPSCQYAIRWRGVARTSTAVPLPDKTLLPLMTAT